MKKLLNLLKIKFCRNPRPKRQIPEALKGDLLQEVLSELQEEHQKLDDDIQNLLDIKNKIKNKTPLTVEELKEIDIVSLN